MCSKQTLSIYLEVSYITLCYASQNSASAINVTTPLSVSVHVSGYSQGLDRTCQECTAPVLSQAAEREEGSRIYAE